MEGSMKMKRMFLVGSLCAAALTAAAIAEAADDVVVEAPASNSAAIAASDAAAAAPKDETVKLRGFYGGGSIGGSFFEGGGRHSRIYNRSSDDDNGDGVPDAFDADHISNENNFMWTAFFGYRMADWLGVEVGWTDIGGFKASHDANPAYTNDRDTKISPSVNGLEARLRAWVPLGTDRVAGIGGIGVFVFQSHGNKQCSGRVAGVSDPCNKGVGHFDQAPKALDPKEDSGQALTISAGLQFRVTDNILLRTEYQHFFSVLDQGVDIVTASVVFGFWDVFGQGRAGGSDDLGGVVVE